MKEFPFAVLFPHPAFLLRKWDTFRRAVQNTTVTSIDNRRYLMHFQGKKKKKKIRSGDMR
jgi:hypothetical protein